MREQSPDPDLNLPHHSGSVLDYSITTILSSNALHQRGKSAEK